MSNARAQQFRRTRSDNAISAVRDVVVHRPLAETLALVRDITLLEPFERKVEHAVVRPIDEFSGTYHIEGKVMGVYRWDGEFSYEQHAAGWHSEQIGVRDDGWQISGGFLVSRVDDQRTRITHYEDYTLPAGLRLFRRVFEMYMRMSQRGEMRDLKQLVEQTVG